MPFSAKLARYVRRTLLTLGILATLVALAVLVENWRGRTAWQAHLALAAARGELLESVAAPSAVPPELNFAKTPALDAALFADREAAAHKDFVARLPSLRQKTSWRQGCPVDFSAFVVGAGTETPSPGAAPVRTASQVLELLAPLTPLRTELVHASRERPEAVLVRPVPYTLDKFPDVPLASFQALRGLSSFLRIHASASLASGRHAEAAEDIVVHLRLARACLDMPDAMLIDSMMGIVQCTTATQAIWEGTRAHAFTESELARMQEELRRVRVLVCFAQGIRTERAGGCYLMDRYPVGDLLFPPAGVLGASRDKWTWRSLIVVPHGWRDLNKVNYSEHMDRLLAALASRGTADYQPRVTEFSAVTDAFLKSSSWSPYTVAMRAALPAYGKVISGATHAEASVALADTACALERHRLASGSYPESLVALIPAYLPSTPVDVVDGQPLRYRREDAGDYTLYSVALDGADQGGLVSKETGGHDPNSRTDWAWPRLAAAAPVPAPAPLASP